MLRTPYLKRVKMGWRERKKRVYYMGDHMSSELRSIFPCSGTPRGGGGRQEKKRGLPMGHNASQVGWWARGSRGGGGTIFTPVKIVKGSGLEPDWYGASFGLKIFYVRVIIIRLLIKKQDLIEMYFVVMKSIQ